MKFPIDVVFLDRDLVVLNVSADLPPWRTAAQRGARAVLELPAGEARRMALQPGERLVLQPEVKKDEPPADSDRR